MWIEIYGSEEYDELEELSLPLRECGLKLYHNLLWSIILKVTPLAGVWIEIAGPGSGSVGGLVTPLAGVWIEIKFKLKNMDLFKESLPLRECGLKLSAIPISGLVPTSLPLRECGLKFQDSGF